MITVLKGFFLGDTSYMYIDKIYIYESNLR